jgi:hypothetical protein
MLDIYVVSFSSTWISDSVLMGLMGRMPKVHLHFPFCSLPPS